VTDLLQELGRRHGEQPGTRDGGGGDRVAAGLEHRRLGKALALTEDMDRALLTIRCLAPEPHPSIEHDEEPSRRVTLDEQHGVALDPAYRGPGQKVPELPASDAGEQGQLTHERLVLRAQTELAKRAFGATCLLLARQMMPPPCWVPAKLARKAPNRSAGPIRCGATARLDHGQGLPAAKPYFLGAVPPALAGDAADQRSAIERGPVGWQPRLRAARDGASF
jgi:hypothetical protein